MSTPSDSAGSPGAAGSAINWSADSWFAHFHAEQVSEEFKDFWIGYYGDPSQYQDSEDELHEYWVRCAFAWIGWSARSRQPNATGLSHGAGPQGNGTS